MGFITNETRTEQMVDDDTSALVQPKGKLEKVQREKAQSHHEGATTNADPGSIW